MRFFRNRQACFEMSRVSSIGRQPRHSLFSTRSTCAWLFGVVLTAIGISGQAQTLDQVVPTTQAPPQSIEKAQPRGEPSSPQIPKSLHSPHATMKTFIDAMNRAAEAHDKDEQELRSKALEDAIDCLDLSRVNPERGPALASRLLGVINRLGLYRGWLGRVYSLENLTEQVYFPDPRFEHVLGSVEGMKPKGKIVLAKQPDGSWLFSAKTIAGIDRLYLSVEKLPVLAGVDEKQLSSEFWLRQFMPASLKGETLLTLEYWQWAALLAFIFLGILLDHVFRQLVRGVARYIIERQGGVADPARMRLTVRPAGLLVMALFWINLVWLLGLPDMAFTVIQGAAQFFAVLACTFFAWRFNNLISDALIRKAAWTATRVDDVLIPLARTTVRILIVIIAVMYGALSLNFDITPLLASLTIGGVGFAFAAKDTLENFFGSATVLVDQPFSVGDWVAIDDVEGTVETVGLRSTRIRTFYNSLVTVPNANLVRAMVDNYGKRRYRRYKTHIGVQYDTPVETIIAFTEGIREIIRTHPYTRKDYFEVYLNQFAPSSLDILLYVFHETPDWSTELRERERLMLDIIRLADQLGVAFAFPTQTLHIQQEESAGERLPADNPGDGAERNARIRGIRAAQAQMRDQAWRHEPPGPVRFQSGPTRIDDDTQIENRTAGG